MLGEWLSSDNTGLLVELILVLGVSVAVGMLIERLLSRYFSSFFAGSRRREYAALARALRGAPTTLLVLVGLDIYLSNIELPATLKPVVDKLIITIIVIQSSIFLSNLAAGLLKIYTERGRGARNTTTLFLHLAKLVILVLGFLILLEAMGVSLTPILTTLGIAGLAVALALQDTLSNLFSGLYIAISGQLRVGDYVKLDTGIEGFIADIGWRNTVIRTPYGSTIVVPNSKLASAVVTNYHYPDRNFIVPVEVGVSYDSDLEKVERVTIEVAESVMKEVPGGVPGHKPYVRYVAFGEYSIVLRVYLAAQGFPYNLLVVHEFIKRLHKRFREEGIEIPFPITTVRLSGVEAGGAGGAKILEAPVTMNA